MKFASQPNKVVWYCAPTFKMAREICWLPLKQMLHDFHWVEDINESNLTIRVKKSIPGSVLKDVKILITYEAQELIF